MINRIEWFEMPIKAKIEIKGNASTDNLKIHYTHQ
jgi:hypothetical protein